MSVQSAHTMPKKRRLVMVFACIFAAIIIIAGIFAAINFNTLLLMTGRGSVSINDIKQVHNAVNSTGKFNVISENTERNGNVTIKAISKDKAVSLTVIQKKDKSEIITTHVDASKLDTSSIDLTALEKGNLSAITSVKNLADKYIGTILSPKQATGIETYVASQLIKQYIKGNTILTVNHSFGNLRLSMKADTITNQIDLTLNN